MDETHIMTFSQESAYTLQHGNLECKQRQKDVSLQANGYSV